jgi:hypothetical protein
MQSNIMKNFGMRDPFENDPFFNNKGGSLMERSGFGNDIFKNAEKITIPLINDFILDVFPGLI